MKQNNQPDGKVINGSFSTCAPHVNASIMRLLKYDHEMRENVIMIVIVFIIAALFILLSVFAFAYNNWFLGTLFLVPLILTRKILFKLLINSPLVFKRTKEFYRNGLLTPGVIIDVNPIKLLCLSEMGTGGDYECYGLKAIVMKKLPVHDIKLHEKVPCVSVFEEGDSYKHWDDFTPRPISWGTEDEGKIRECLEKIGNDRFEKLQELIVNNDIKHVNGKAILLDKNLKIIN